MKYQDHFGDSSATAWNFLYLRSTSAKRACIIQRDGITATILHPSAPPPTPPSRWDAFSPNPRGPNQPLDKITYCSYVYFVRITCDPAKREWTLHERGLDMLRAHEVFVGSHFSRVDDRQDYGEPRFITVGWLDSRLVVFAWTPRGAARRVISMMHCHEREAKKLLPHLA